MKWITIAVQSLDILSKIFSYKYISWYKDMTFWNGWSELLIRDRESENYKWYWHSSSNITCPISLQLVLAIFLSSFFSPISFYLLSSCNCRIYKGKIGIRSSPNSGRDPGTFFFLFRKGRSLFFQFSSVAQSCPTLQPHGLQHTRLPCPSPIPRAYSNSCPWSQWCHPTISSSVIPFSSRLQSFPEPGSFPMS